MIERKIDDAGRVTTTREGYSVSLVALVAAGSFCSLPVDQEIGDPSTGNVRRDERRLGIAVQGRVAGRSRNQDTSVSYNWSTTLIPAVIDRRSFISLNASAFCYETLVDETVTVPVTIPSSPKVAITIA